ncbi:MAG TPA: hypothetical protein PLM62_21250 [Zoogloea sp.]|nr:hypothetical protein [Zoogloea sp.]
MSGCASDPAKEQAINNPPPEDNLSRTTILPVTPKPEDKTTCLNQAHAAAVKFSQNADGPLAMLGPLSVIGIFAGVSHMNSICEEQMKTCLEKKGYTYPK